MLQEKATNSPTRQHFFLVMNLGFGLASACLTQQLRCHMEIALRPLKVTLPKTGSQLRQ